MGALLCPRCRAPLVEHRAPRFGAFACAACAGLWVEFSTYQVLTRYAFDQASSVGAKVDPQKLRRGMPPIACVVCGEGMSQHAAGFGAAEIDCCPKHGYWFDRGELEAVTQARAASERQRRTQARLETGAEVAKTFLEIGEALLG